MIDIIKIDKKTFNQEVKESVNARDLHKFLQIESKFPDWIKNKLVDFIENKDYISFSFFSDNGRMLLKSYAMLGNPNHFESYLITPKGFDYFLKKVNKGSFDSVKI
mgnify:FL=1